MIFYFLILSVTTSPKFTRIVNSKRKRVACFLAALVGAKKLPIFHRSTRVIQGILSYLPYRTIEWLVITIISPSNMAHTITHQLATTLRSDELGGAGRL